MAAAPPFAGENLNQHQYYFLAKLSEQGRQFEDMAFYMRSLFGLKTLPHFSNEEINLLVTSHQNLIDPLRAAWQTSTVAERENNDENAFGFFPHLATEYKQYIELKILTVCNDFLNLLRAKLNTEECPDERRAYLWRLVADFNRYIVEINHADNRRDDVYRTVYAYTQARVITSSIISIYLLQKRNCAWNQFLDNFFLKTPFIIMSYFSSVTISIHILLLQK